MLNLFFNCHHRDLRIEHTTPNIGCIKCSKKEWSECFYCQEHSPKHVGRGEKSRYPYSNANNPLVPIHFLARSGTKYHKGLPNEHRQAANTLPWSSGK